MADTQWKSMFDGGACKVEVWSGGGSTSLWSGTLDKGDVSDPFQDSMENNLHVTVSDDGAVTLATTGAGEPAGMMLLVFPQYDTSTLKTGMVDISAWRFGEAQDYTGTALCDDDSQTVDLDFSTLPATPSSATFDAHDAGSGGAFVGVSYQGIG